MAINRCFTVAVLVPFVLAGCAAVGTQDGTMATQVRKGGFMGLADKDIVEVEYAAPFKGVEQVVIGGFKVGFNDSKRLEEKRQGVFGPGTTTTGLVKLTGVDDGVRQSITDTIYAEFLELLQDKGYQVVAREPFVASPQYAKIKQASFPYKIDQSGLFSSYGVGHYYSPTALGTQQPFFPGENNTSPFGDFGAYSVMEAVDAYSRDTDIRVLNVSFMSDFAGAASGDYFSSTMLKVGQLMAVDSGMLIISRNDKGIRNARIGQLTLGQPVGSDKPFATIENTTTDAEAAVEAAGNVVAGLLTGGLIGAGNRVANQTREFLFTADPDQYADAALDSMRRASALLVDKMAELR